jgi:V-type H+-transporting ATPase subunit A
MSFQSPSQGKDDVKGKLEDLYTEIQEKFRQLHE